MILCLAISLGVFKWNYGTQVRDRSKGQHHQASYLFEIKVVIHKKVSINLFDDHQSQNQRMVQNRT